MSEPIRSRQARNLAEAALVRLVQAYGKVPEFVLLGGLVPDLLCSQAPQAHVGTTDVDVQVDLEIQGGSANAARLERALIDANFKPDNTRIWRWKDNAAPGLLVKVEFLADLPKCSDREHCEVEDCETLGALNLRGTGFASQAWELRSITAALAGQTVTALIELSANFADDRAQGSLAYAETMLRLHPGLDADLLANDAVTAVVAFIAELNISR